MSPQAWELVLMMFVLKIPIVAGCLLVWWAIRAEPRPLEGAVARHEPLPEDPRAPTRRRRRPLRPGPRGRPGRRLARREPAALMRAGRRR